MVSRAHSSRVRCRLYPRSFARRRRGEIRGCPNAPRTYASWHEEHAYRLRDSTALGLVRIEPCHLHRRWPGRAPSVLFRHARSPQHSGPRDQPDAGGLPGERLATQPFRTLASSSPLRACSSAHEHGHGLEGRGRLRAHRASHPLHRRADLPGEAIAGHGIHRGLDRRDHRIGMALGEDRHRCRGCDGEAACTHPE